MGTAPASRSSPAKRKHASTIRQKPRLKRMGKGKYNGKPVFDAKVPLNIMISKADLVSAQRGNPEHCAAAQSLNRSVPAIVAAHVYRSRVFVEYANKVERYVTPGRLRQETISFDRGTPDKFIEGEYKILPPSDSNRLGRYKHVSKNPGGKNGPVKHKVRGARRTAVGMLFKRKMK